MSGIRRKVSAVDGADPYDRSREAEHNRRQTEGKQPFPAGGCTVSGTAPSTGTVALEHSLGRTPRHWIIFDQDQPARLGSTARDEHTISIENAEAVGVDFTVYVW